MLALTAGGSGSSQNCNPCRCPKVAQGLSPSVQLRVWGSAIASLPAVETLHFTLNPTSPSMGRYKPRAINALSVISQVIRSKGMSGVEVLEQL